MKNELGIATLMLLIAVSMAANASKKYTSFPFQLRIHDEATTVIIPEGEKIIISGVWHKPSEPVTSPRCTIEGKKVAASSLDDFEQGLSSPIVLETGVYRFATDTDDTRPLYKESGGICFFKGRRIDMGM